MRPNTLVVDRTLGSNAFHPRSIFVPHGSEAKDQQIIWHASHSHWEKDGPKPIDGANELLFQPEDMSCAPATILAPQRLGGFRLQYWFEFS